jgi:hypothetical protein
MKTLTKRTKTLLAIAAVVIIVIVAGGYLLAVSGPAELPLFGTTGAYIDPPKLCVNPGSTRSLTVKNVVLNPNWSSENTGIAFLPSTDGKKAYVKGVAIGDTYVKAKSTFYSASAHVYVSHVCPLMSAMWPNTSVKFVTDLTGGQWMSNNTAVATVGSDGTVHSHALGNATIYYKMPNDTYTPPNDGRFSIPDGWATVTVANNPPYVGMGW